MRLVADPNKKKNINSSDNYVNTLQKTNYKTVQVT